MKFRVDPDCLALNFMRNLNNRNAIKFLPTCQYPFLITFAFSLKKSLLFPSDTFPLAFARNSRETVTDQAGAILFESIISGVGRGFVLLTITPITPK